MNSDAQSRCCCCAAQPTRRDGKTDATSHNNIGISAFKRSSISKFEWNSPAQRHCEVLIFLGLGTCKTKRPPIHSRTNSLTLPLQSWRRNILPLPANPPISHGRCHPSGGITAADNKKIHRWKKDNRHQEKLSSPHFQSSSPCHLVFVHPTQSNNTSAEQSTKSPHTVLQTSPSPSNHAVSEPKLASRNCLLNQLAAAVYLPSSVAPSTLAACSM